jgi:hypothetical protein
MREQIAQVLCAETALAWLQRIVGSGSARTVVVRLSAVVLAIPEGRRYTRIRRR